MAPLGHGVRCRRISRCLMNDDLHYVAWQDHSLPTLLSRSTRTDSSSHLAGVSGIHLAASRRGNLGGPLPRFDRKCSTRYPSHRCRTPGHCHLAPRLCVRALAPPVTVAAVPGRRGRSPSLGPVGYRRNRLVAEHFIHQEVPVGIPSWHIDLPLLYHIGTCRSATFGQRAPSAFGLI